MRKNPIPSRLKLKADRITYGETPKRHIGGHSRWIIHTTLDLWMTTGTTLPYWHWIAQVQATSR